MNRSCISASLVVSGVLVLSACGASKPSQATTPSSTSPAARPTAASPAAARPTVGSSQAASTRIGPYTQIFATPLPASPAKAKVSQGFEMAEILWAKSEYAWRPVPPVTKYVTGPALAHLMAATSSLKANDVVPAGTDRSSGRRASAPGPGARVAASGHTARARPAQQVSPGRRSPRAGTRTGCR
jgi:hypothetical protein